MLPFIRYVCAVLTVAEVVLAVVGDVFAFVLLCLRTICCRRRESLPTETTRPVRERKIKPRRATHSIRFTLAQLSHFFDWQRSHDGEARHADTLASPWIPIVLEMEIATSRPSTYTCQLAAAYS
jgi:hypothetical protein